MHDKGRIYIGLQEHFFMLQLHLFCLLLFAIIGQALGSLHQEQEGGEQQEVHKIQVIKLPHMTSEMKITEVIILVLLGHIRLKMQLKIHICNRQHNKCYGQHHPETTITLLLEKGRYQYQAVQVIENNDEPVIKQEV
ncbi:hypothetical protein D3C87_1648870 [compost metagenome]